MASGASTGEQYLQYIRKFIVREIPSSGGRQNHCFRRAYVIVKNKVLYLFIYLFIYLAFSLSGEGHCYRFPQLQQALLYRFVVEEVTVHNTGISLFHNIPEKAKQKKY